MYLNNKMKRPVFAVVFLFLFLFTLTAAADIEVKGAGVTEADGVYKQDGTYNEHPLYVKGNCQIRYKGCRAKWMLYIGDRAFYRNMTDSDECPLEKWRFACAAKPISKKVPQFNVFFNSKNKPSKQNKNTGDFK